MSDSLVIIPTYNEKENVEAIINAVFTETTFDVLIVDDNSPDGTANIVKNLQQTTDRLHLLEREGKQGLGTAYIAGFRWALDKGYEYIFEMDADFSHPVEKLVELRAACAEGGADMSVGSRYCKGGKVSNWPWDRILMSYGASLYVRTILWIPVADTTAGFKCYTAKVLRTIDLDSIKFVGYAFQIEMKYKAYKAGFKIKEVPITFKDRTKGQSKMNMGIFNEAIVGVLKMRFSK